MSDPGSRILIVDDEAGIRRFLHASLESRGYSIHEASTGEEALQVVPAFRPDLILLDLGLPGIGGKQVTGCLREWTQTPIIILSVQGDESEKIAALDAGADDYLTKPFGAGELLARIRAALRRVGQQEDHRRDRRRRRGNQGGEGADARRADARRGGVPRVDRNPI